MKITTKNYLLEFKGWAQGRIPTDPDPSNDPRGVSGYTFALPGEPDLDRIIYFQQKDGVIRRSHCPAVGVFVTSGYEFVTEGKGGEVEFVSKIPIVEGHPLYNAKIDLLGNATFDSRNSTLIYNGFGIVNPFMIGIEGNDLTISRRFYADTSNEQDSLENYDISTLTPFMMTTVVVNSLEIILGSDVLDRTAFRNERRELLQKDLAVLREQEQKNPNDTSVLIQIAALEKRIAELKLNDPANRRTNQIGTQVMINYPLNAKTASLNNEPIAPLVPWPTMIWLGGWDADAMGFCVNGYVQVILQEEIG